MERIWRWGYKVVITHHVYDYTVGISVWHQARQGSAARHAEAAAVVDDDEVATSSFDEFRRQANASTRADDGFALGDSSAETGKDLVSVCWWSHG